ncbi:MAG: hypothetical protein ABI664_00600 [bacterium]
MIALLLALLQQSPDSHYAGGASSKTAGTTALAGHLFRFLFTTVPQWVQLGGIFVGIPIAMFVAWKMWKNRRALWAWWLSRTTPVKVALSTAVLVVASAGIGSTLYGYNYMMHENDFCQSCHVMDGAWNRFQVSAHKDIQCHGCHRQPMYVSSVELFWWVTQRLMTVPPHDKVPNKVCGECHMREGTDSARTLVTLTAGHALHLNSTKKELKDVQCVSCHGRDFHQFKPTSFSCTQSGCHFNLRVNLGAMSTQGFQHCTSCHDFKGKVAPGTSPSDAKLALVPKVAECTSCHAMTQNVKNFDLAADPHKGNCGMCHDVHKNVAPKDAYKSCTTAGCHSNADTLTAFHRGLGKHALDKCSACHQAHSWKVKGSNCLACHANINQDRPQARRSSSIPILAPLRRHMSRSRAPSVIAHLTSFVTVAVVTPSRAPPTIAPARDSAFRHSRHTTVGCTQCHSTSSSHGGLTFTRPAGCQACHHSPKQKATCTKCHDPSSLSERAMPMTFAISARRAPVTRQVGFTHAKHDAVECAKCHTGGTRAFTGTCASCHVSHHSATADCASCHTTARDGHDRASHAGCAGCHTDATVVALPSSRAVCLTCHVPQRTHYPQGECATCHALADHGMMRAVGPRSAQ